jgi:hypothetical protein
MAATSRNIGSDGWGGKTCVELPRLAADKQNEYAINAASRQNLTFPGDNFGAGANDDIDTLLRIGIAGFADACNATVFDTEIRFNNAPVIDDECVGDHQIHRHRGINPALPHAVADDLAATEFDFITVNRAICLYFQKQAAIAQTQRSPVVVPNISA